MYSVVIASAHFRNVCLLLPLVAVLEDLWLFLLTFAAVFVYGLGAAVIFKTSCVSSVVLNRVCSFMACFFGKAITNAISTAVLNVRSLLDRSCFWICSSASPITNWSRSAVEIYSQNPLVLANLLKTIVYSCRSSPAN